MILATLGRIDEARAALGALPPALLIMSGLQFGIEIQAGRMREAEALYPTVLATGLLPKPYMLLLLGRRAEAVAALDVTTVDNPGNYLQVEYDQLDADPGFQRFIATLGWTEARARVKAWRAVHPPERRAKP